MHGGVETAAARGSLLALRSGLRLQLQSSCRRNHADAEKISDISARIAIDLHEAPHRSRHIDALAGFTLHRNGANRLKGWHADSCNAMHDCRKIVASATNWPVQASHQLP
ncbi:hypothetical protein [Paraburkholderia jirisanensis]